MKHIDMDICNVRVDMWVADSAATRCNELENFNTHFEFYASREGNHFKRTASMT
jgi:hypothetical protein